MTTSDFGSNLIPPRVAWNKGKTLSETHRLKISETNKGKPKTTEHRLKISESNKGRMPWNKGNSTKALKG